MSTLTAQKFESVLVEKELITKDKYESLKKEQIRSGGSFEDLITRQNLISKEDILKLKSEILDVPLVDPTQYTLASELAKLIPESTARKYNLFPLNKSESTITVAMADPHDLGIIEFIERSSHLRVVPNLSSVELITLAIDKEYSKSLGEDVTLAIEQAAATSTTKLQEKLQDIDKVEEIIRVSPVAQIVSVILEYAVKSGSSDIHIEPFENGTRIRYRIDGVLQEKFPLPKTIHNSVVARIKILANMQIDEHRKPLDGKFKVIFGDKKIDLRISSLPTAYGEKVAIRLLKDQGKEFTFKQLGLWGESRKDFEDALRETTGIILVTGPTSSGKTVTLATTLTKLNSTKVNIVTLEDPVEIMIPGVNQVQINPPAGLTFATGLRSILRQNPNIIMVGEIRDKETAGLAIQAALTGHLVLATLHTNSAAGAIPRLVDMGVETFLLASTINLSVAQRLTRRICTHCKEEYVPEPKIQEDIKKVLGENLIKLGMGTSAFADDDDDYAGDTDENNKSGGEATSKDSSKPASPGLIKLYRGKGCDKCGNTGYKGQIALFEVMNVDREIRDLIIKNSGSEDIDKIARKNGMISLVQDGYLKALWGITTLEEVLSVAGQ